MTLRAKNIVIINKLLHKDEKLQQKFTVKELIL